MLLILVQPDFGTASVFMFVCVILLFVAGIGVKYIIGGVAALAAILPFAWFFVLQDYQKNRIINVFNPENDPYIIHPYNAANFRKEKVKNKNRRAIWLEILYIYTCIPNIVY